ncbi:MAG: hypothetical protein ACRDF7_00035 [Candidatus Limnocylindrales bacterium]
MLDAITFPRAQLETLEVLGRPAAHEAVMTLRYLVAQPNVVGVGIAEKVSAGHGTGRLALTIYVEEKRPTSRLAWAEMFSPTLPEALGTRDVPTDVVEIGRLHPEANWQRTPIEPGFSIGHPLVSAGTLGAFVGSATTPRILSASHVLADSGRARIGDPILYPGPGDYGVVPDDVIARLTQVVPFVLGGDFVNRMDAALATVEPSVRGNLRSRNSAIRAVPIRTTIPQRNMEVVKVGRTTGLTHGQVRDVNFRFSLDYPGVGTAGFLDQVLCTRYTAGGDSGSLVFEEGSGLAVGLHFAGANGGSVFSPIRPVLRALNVGFVRRVLSA